MVCGNQCYNCGAILASRACQREAQRSELLNFLRCLVLCVVRSCQKMVRHLLTWLHIFVHFSRMVIWSSNHLILHVCLRVRCCSLNTYMIDSRRVLCSFDCDSAQSFLASQMENWQRTIAATQPERPTKVRRNSNTTGSKDDLERQLLFVSTRLGLRNARDVSLLNSICYSTVKLPKDHAVCVAAAEARTSHATRTRGKSGHGEGSLDEYAFVGTCLALHQNLQDANGQSAIKEFLDAHPTQRQETGSCCALLSSARSMARSTRQVLFPTQPCVYHVCDEHHDSTRAKRRRQTVRTSSTWQSRTESSGPTPKTWGSDRQTDRFMFVQHLHNGWRGQPALSLCAIHRDSSGSASLRGVRSI